MVVPAITRLQETLGDEGVDELIALVDERLREQAVLRDEWPQVITRDEFRREVVERFQRIDDRLIEMDRHFEARFEEMNRHFENRFDKMEQRLEARLDGRLGEMGQRLDRMDQRLDRMDQRFDEINRRFDQMYDRMLVQSWWLIGSIALLGTVISILLAIGQFVK